MNLSTNHPNPSESGNHSAGSGERGPDTTRTAPNSQPNGSPDPAAPKVHRALLHKGAKFSFETVTLEAKDGSLLTREVVRHPGAVVIVPILDAPIAGSPNRQEVRQVVFIRNWRLSLERWLDELPAGTIEPGEPPEVCAARELEEETGYSAGRLIHLASFCTTPGLTDELMHAYAAFDLTPVGQDLELDERVTVHPRTVPETNALIRSNRLADAKSLCALLIAARKGLLEFE